MTMEATGDFVNVGIRVKPSCNGNHATEGIKVFREQGPVLCVVEKKQWYSFDNIFTQDCEQAEIYQQMVQPLVKQALSGYNCTVFAYGQTGTGKTYTIGTDPDSHNDAGFISKTLDEFFNYQEEHKEIGITISFCEIYNEVVYDLLDTKSSEPLTVVGFKVKGLIEEHIKSSNEARSLLKLGSKNRHVGDTKQNNNSSRSHAIFTICCKVKHENHKTSAKFNLVDLAGSESIKNTGNIGSQLKEGISINIGLLALGGVMHALSSHSSHIPYRNSIITSVLRDSLSITNFVTLVACISPDIQDISETIQTLDFAQKSSKIKNRPEINAFIQHQKTENPTLFEKPVLGSKFKIQATPSKRNNYYSVSDSSTAKKVKVVTNAHHAKFHKNGIADERMIGDTLVSTCVSPISKAVDVPFSITPMVQRCTLAVGAVVEEKISTMLKNFTLSPQFRLMQRMTEMINRTRANELNENVGFTSSPINCSREIPCISDASLIAPTRLNFDNDVSCVNDESTFKVPIAPSLKLQKKPKTSKNLLNKLNTDPSKLPVNLSDAGPSNSKIAPRRSVRLCSKEINTARRSPRFASKETNTTLVVPETASSKKRARTSRRSNVSTSSTSSNSPKTSHTNYVIHLLNTGTVKELQKLSSVGIKTATQIFTFRQLNGGIKTLKDLAKMPSWRGTFQRFLKENFLKID